jgi:PAS domain S-box-containing protein
MNIPSPGPVSDDSARAAEELWQTFFLNPHIGVAIVGPDRRFLETNERFRELVGYTEEEITALTVLDISHPEDRPAHVKTADLLRTGRARDVHIEKRYVRKDGGIVWVRVTAMLRSANPYSTIALVEDVTERKAVEERLERQDSLFREAQRIAHFGTWEWDPVANVAIWSEELCRIAGVDATFRPSLESSLDHVVPEERESVRRTIEGAIARGTNIENDTRIVRPDGSTRTLRISGVPVFDDSGAVTRVVGVTQDITERREAELDALENERRLRLVVDQMQAIAWTTDRDLRYTSSFGAGLKAAGLSPEEATGRTVFEFVSGNPDAVEVSAHRRALAGESCTYDSTYASRIFQAHIEPLRDETGEITGVIGIAVDVSEQRRGEELLRESEGRYRLLFESNPSPMWVIDAETFQFLAVNDAALHHYGYSREEFLSMKTTDIRTPEEAVRWKEFFRTRPETYKGGIWRHLKKDGTEIHVEVASRAITFDGVPARAALVRDVTDRRRAQERLARSEREMRALTARLQTIREEEDARVAREVHDEIGQALTGLGLDVAWLTNNLNRKGARGKFVEKLRSMAELIEATTGSVERIASKLRPGILDEVGLGAAAEWAVRQFQDRSGVDCHFESNLNGDSFDLERATAIFRILQEALMNVARHARARHVEVRLRAEAGRLHLDVSDDGAGIDPARIADSRSFGLLGMRERARALQGNCVIASRPEGGTLVSATIPLAAAP